MKNIKLNIKPLQKSNNEAIGWFSNYMFLYIISRSKQLYESHENTKYIWFGFGGTLETSRGGKYRLPHLDNN